MKTQELKLKARAGSVLSHGWDVLWDKFITLFLLLLVLTVISMPFSITHSNDPQSYGAVVLQSFALLYALFLIAPFKYGVDYLYLKAIRLFKIDVKELFSVFDNYLNIVLANLLTGAIIAIGFVFVLVPGIIFACRLAFVPYLVMDKKYDPVKAVEESWRISRGYGWRIFWLYIVSFFLIIAGLIVLVFGSVIAIMWINAAFAAMYQAVLQERGEYQSEIRESVDSNDIVATEPEESTESQDE